MRWFIRGYAKRLLSIQVAALILCFIVVSMPGTGTEGRPEFWCGNVIIGEDFIDNGMTQDLFHQQTLATASDSALAISLPSSQAGFSPAISQTDTDTAVATSTGFMEANYMFSPGFNFGAAPVGIGQLGAPSPVTPAKFSARSVFYPEMVNRGNLLNNSQLREYNTTRMTLPPAQAGGASNLIWRMANEQSNQSAIGLDARDKNMTVMLSEKTIDPNALPEQINNTSTVERLWRNTHQGSVLDSAYEGDAAYPTWIAPFKNPILLIDCGDPFDTIHTALELTMPGRYLTTAFWNL